MNQESLDFLENESNQILEEEINDETLKRSLFTALTSTFSESFDITIPICLSAFVQALNETPTMTNKMDTNQIEKLSNIMKIMFTTFAGTYGIINFQKDDNIYKLTYSGAILEIFLFALKSHFKMITNILQDLSNSLMIYRTNRNLDQFLIVCYSILKKKYLMQSEAIICDCESPNLEKIFKLPLIRADVDIFCDKLTSIITIADRIRMGIDTIQSTAQDEILLNQIILETNNLSLQYSNVFLDLSHKIRSLYIPSYSETPFSIFQQICYKPILMITKIVFGYVESTVFHQTNILNEHITVIEKYVNCLFSLLYSKDKIARYKCDYHKEKGNLMDKYQIIQKSASEILTIINFLTANCNCHFVSFYKDFLGDSYEKLYSDIISLNKPIESLLKGVETDEKFILYSSLTPEILLKYDDHTNNVHLHETIIDLIKIIENFHESLRKFDLFVCNQILEKDIYPKIQDFCMNVLQSKIMSCNNHSNKLKYLHTADKIQFTMEQLIESFEILKNDEQNKNKEIRKFHCDLLTNELILSLCSSDFHFQQLDIFDMVFDRLLTHLNSLFPLLTPFLTEITQILLNNNQNSFEKAHQTIQNLILHVYEIIYPIDSSNFPMILQSFDELQILFSSIIHLLQSYNKNNDVNNFCNAESMLKSIILILESLPKLIKDLLSIKLLLSCQLFSSLAHNGVHLLNILSKLRPASYAIKIQIPVAKLETVSKKFSDEIEKNQLIWTYDNTFYLAMKTSLATIISDSKYIFDEISNFIEFPYYQKVITNDVLLYKNLVQKFDFFEAQEFFFNPLKLSFPDFLIVYPFLVFHLMEITPIIGKLVDSMKTNQMKVSYHSFILSQKVSHLIPFFDFIHAEEISGSTSHLQKLATLLIHFGALFSIVCDMDSKLIVIIQKIVPLLKRNMEISKSMTDELISSLKYKSMNDSSSNTSSVYIESINPERLNLLPSILVTPSIPELAKNDHINYNNDSSQIAENNDEINNENENQNKTDQGSVNNDMRKEVNDEDFEFNKNKEYFISNFGKHNDLDSKYQSETKFQIHDRHNSDKTIDDLSDVISNNPMIKASDILKPEKFGSSLIGLPSPSQHYNDCDFTEDFKNDAENNSFSVNNTEKTIITDHENNINPIFGIGNVAKKMKKSQTVIIKPENINPIFGSRSFGQNTTLFQNENEDSSESDSCNDSDDEDEDSNKSPFAKFLKQPTEVPAFFNLNDQNRSKSFTATVNSPLGLAFVRPPSYSVISESESESNDSTSEEDGLPPPAPFAESSFALNTTNPKIANIFHYISALRREISTIDSNLQNIKNKVGDRKIHAKNILDIALRIDTTISNIINVSNK